MTAVASILSVNNQAYSLFVFATPLLVCCDFCYRVVFATTSRFAMSLVLQFRISRTKEQEAEFFALISCLSPLLLLPHYDSKKELITKVQLASLWSSLPKAIASDGGR